MMLSNSWRFYIFLTICFLSLLGFGSAELCVAARISDKVYIVEVDELAELTCAGLKQVICLLTAHF